MGDVHAAQRRTTDRTEPQTNHLVYQHNARPGRRDRHKNKGDMDMNMGNSMEVDGHDLWRTLYWYSSDSRSDDGWPGQH